MSLVLDASHGGGELALKVDSLAKKGEKQIVLLARKVPQQFIDNLKARGTETVLVEAGEMKKTVIDRVLKSSRHPIFIRYTFLLHPRESRKPRRCDQLSSIQDNA